VEQAEVHMHSGISIGVHLLCDLEQVPMHMGTSGVGVHLHSGTCVGTLYTIIAKLLGCTSTVI
jgi:hypothetical protein